MAWALNMQFLSLGDFEPGDGFSSTCKFMFHYKMLEAANFIVLLTDFFFFFLLDLAERIQER